MVVVGSGVVVVVVGSGVVEDVVGAKTHCPHSGQLHPELQKHALTPVLPNGECEFAGQFTHTYAGGATTAVVSRACQQQLPCADTWASGRPGVAGVAGAIILCCACGR